MAVHDFSVGKTYLTDTRYNRRFKRSNLRARIVPTLIGYDLNVTTDQGDLVGRYRGYPTQMAAVKDAVKVFGVHRNKISKSEIGGVYKRKKGRLMRTSKNPKPIKRSKQITGNGEYITIAQAGPILEVYSVAGQGRSGGGEYEYSSTSSASAAYKRLTSLRRIEEWFDRMRSRDAFTRTNPKKRSRKMAKRKRNPGSYAGKTKKNPAVIDIGGTITPKMIPKIKGDRRASYKKVVVRPNSSVSFTQGKYWVLLHRLWSGSYALSIMRYKNAKERRDAHKVPYPTPHAYYEYKVWGSDSTLREIYSYLWARAQMKGDRAAGIAATIKLVEESSKKQFAKTLDRISWSI